MIPVGYLILGILLTVILGGITVAGLFLDGRQRIKKINQHWQTKLDLVTADKELEHKSFLMEVNRLTEELQSAQEARAKELSHRKSSEVRTGQIAETMAPFLSGFRYDPKRATFIGNPIDFVVFDTKGVHFIEVKSGKSRLSKGQKTIRDQINSGKVTFELFRVNADERK